MEVQPVSRARCSVLHAATQNRDQLFNRWTPGQQRTAVTLEMALLRFPALRCIRGTRSYLPLHKRHGFFDRRARGAIAVDAVTVIRKAERDSAHHPPVITEPEVTADQARPVRQGGLRNDAEPERLRGKHEIADIGAAIDRAVHTKRLIGMDDRHMWRAEKIEIFQRLFCIRRLVAARNSQRVVQLKAALAPPREIDTAVLARKREIAVIGRARNCRGINLLAEFFLRLAACDHDLPRLAVAPGRGALRGFEDSLDQRTRYGIRLEGAAGKALAEQFLQHADALLDSEPPLRPTAGRHLHLPASFGRDLVERNVLVD